METADKSNSLLLPPLDADPEERGLRILSKILARRLAKSRRDKNAMAYEQGKNDSPIIAEGIISKTVEQEGLIDKSSIFEVKRSG